VNKFKKGFSFEFFPPRTSASVEKLQITQDRLSKLQPAYFSVTYGAGGSTQEKTFETVLDIRSKTGIDAAPHLSCIGASTEQLRQVLTKYRENHFKHIVALRGDLPSGSVGTGSLLYASELVEFIRKESGDYFNIDVACYPEFHPQSQTATQDLQNFKRKVEAGANSAITQYFYNVDAYFRFMDNCEQLGIDIPIVPGVMPIVNYTQLARFSEACGAEIPRWILQRLRDYGDDKKAIMEFGVDVTSVLCQKLLDGGALGLHFYTMNQADAVEQIWENLGLEKV
jgi:methylenetetrahydrofolate reductase (NADPH)